ncbi:MAG: alginate export family protein [Planctomycetota bacterium]
MRVLHLYRLARTFRVVLIAAVCGLPGWGESCVGQEASQQVAADQTESFELPETGPIRERPDDDPDIGFLERVLPLNSDVLRISGEFREQYESWRNREFGFAEDADNDYLLQRLYIDFDLRPNDWFLARVELGSAFQFGSPFEPSPIDEDPIFFQQLLSEVTLLEGDRGRLFATIGRQTFGLGSGRLVATRNGPNIRRSFDAALLSLDNDSLTTQLIVGSEVAFGGDAFDNDPTTDRMLWGSYNTLKAGPDSFLPGKGGLDLYYLGYRNAEARFDSAEGDEHRHSFGVRAFGLFGQGNAWDYNIEPMIQFGTIEDQEILAWSKASIIGYTFDSAPLRPRLGIKFDAISGDRNPNDRKLGTFNALYPNNSYFSEAAAFAPANLYDLNLNADLELSESVKLVVLWDFLWRQSTTDAIYVPPGIPGIEGDATDERYIGNTVSIAMEWQPVSSIETTAAYVHLEPGDAIFEAGGREADFVLLWATWFF